MTRFVTRCARIGTRAAMALTVLLYVACGSDETTSPLDVTPPAAVVDLAVASATSSSATLNWTAPGDDGAAGTAAQYDLRYATGGSAAWGTMTQATGEPRPRAAGETESFTVTGLAPGTQYVFQLRAVDDAGNWSPESGAANVTTEQTADTSAPWWGSSSVGTGYSTPTTILLWWSAPTDDRGAAAHYDIRYATVAQAPWDAMTVLTDATQPAEANTREVRAVAGLDPNTPYYFRIKAADAAGNWSPESHEGAGRTTRAGDGTEVTGDILLNLVWSADGSPYRISGAVSIRDATLTIEPGVEVRGGDLRIAPLIGLDPDETGTLVADAGGGAPIRFGSVSILPSAGSLPTTLRNCVLDSTTVFGEGRVSFVDCTIQHARSTALWFRGNPLPTDDSLVSIVRCRFEDNRSGSIAGCIQFEGGWLLMQETTMVGNGGRSIVSLIGNVVIEGCRFEGNTLVTPESGATVAIRGGNSSLDLSCSSFAGNLYDLGYGCREVLVDALTSAPSVVVERCNFELDRTVLDNDSWGQPDARNNWWGTVSPAAIEAAIVDSLDVPCCRGHVRYEPFLSSAVDSASCGRGNGR